MIEEGPSLVELNDVSNDDNVLQVTEVVHLNNVSNSCEENMDHVMPNSKNVPSCITNPNNADPIAIMNSNTFNGQDFGKNTNVDNQMVVSDGAKYVLTLEDGEIAAGDLCPIPATSLKECAMNVTDNWEEDSSFMQDDCPYLLGFHSNDTIVCLVGDWSNDFIGFSAKGKSHCFSPTFWGVGSIEGVMDWHLDINGWLIKYYCLYFFCYGYLGTQNYCLFLCSAGETRDPLDDFSKAVACSLYVLWDVWWFDVGLFLNILYYLMPILGFDGGPFL
ncbi:hypothetical protein MA16_Dca019071 [Dendrobium catenatum]|uniref:Uncharacterized protein n=1 Tax=Dendrobium catenatum TaxID=906689 RepID=A0A2I0VU92_9ASPA|nr:hypothetical protein MA16_Dca019071 [Dendrobium catenatum]